MNSVELALKVSSQADTSGLDKTTTKASRMGKVGNAAGKLLAGGLLLAAAAAVKMTQGAAEDEKAAASLAHTLRKVTGATAQQVAANEDWIATQGKVLGVADDELRPAMDALATATGSVSKAQRLSTLAMDISAKRGKSLQSVSAALAKAYKTGNVAALAKYGVEVKKTDGKTRSLQAVTRDLAKTYKGSAAGAAQTTAGKQKILQVKMDELQESIGARLIPVMLKLVNVGMKVVGWIENNQRAAGIIIGTLGGLLAVTFAVSKAIQVWSAVTKVAAAVQWLLNAAMTANPIGLVVIAIVALVAALIIAYKKSETFRRIVDGAFKAVKKAAGVAVDFIRRIFPPVFAVISKPYKLAYTVIKTVFSKVTAAAQVVIGWVRNNWPKLKALMSAPFDAVKTLAGKALDKLRSGVSAAKDAVKRAFDAMWAPIQKIINAVQSLIDKIRSVPKIGGGGMVSGGTTPIKRTTTERVPLASAQRGGDTYYVDMSGLIDSDQGAEKIMRLLNDRARRTGGRVVVA